MAVERIVIIRETCERCEGTGLIHEGYTYDCPVCQGRGMVQVSKTKEVLDE